MVPLHITASKLGTRSQYSHLRSNFYAYQEHKFMILPCGVSVHLMCLIFSGCPLKVLPAKSLVITRDKKVTTKQSGFICIAAVNFNFTS